MLDTADLEELVFYLFPRKVQCDPEEAEEIIAELGAFWRFLHAEHDVTPFPVGHVLGEGAVDRLREALADPSNFGSAKSLFTRGQAAGYDMQSQSGMDAFARDQNRALADRSLPRPVATPVRRAEEKVGRNQPCPCGSGKKYKKCCGR